VEIAGRNRRARLSEQRHKVQSDELEEQELVTLSVEELRAMLMSAEGPKEIKWQSACALAVLHLQDYPFRRTDQ